ncbi:MAG: helix-turn-helix domain-containing protein [Actinobacteria bacterium]|nr:helix-turn-helix domain-containing protein [Actinomycetota bacterium]
MQAIVDALSVALRRPVVLDDAALAPLAYSRQWGVDAVRSESILSRGASPAVREALLAQGIAGAHDVMHTAPDAGLGMEARVCMPVRQGRQVLGYIWLLDPQADLTEAELGRVRRAARELTALIAGRAPRPAVDEAALVERLRSSDPAVRAQAAADARDRRLLADGRVVLCLLSAGTAGTDPLAAARTAVQRLASGHAIAATVPEGGALIASLGDPVLRTLPGDDVAAWLRTVAGADVVVGQSAPAALTALDEASREALVALRVARSRAPAHAAAWSSLGADRLVAQLPVDAVRDLPERLAHLLREEPVLVATLAAFLDAAGDVRATAAALSLHRSGLYYRLRRIEELGGLDLSRGDDRLLAHLAVRAERMS